MSARVDRATCPHGGLLLCEDPDIYDCPHGCGADWDGFHCVTCGRRSLDGPECPACQIRDSAERLRELTETGRSVRYTGRPIMTIIADALGPEPDDVACGQADETGEDEAR